MYVYVLQLKSVEKCVSLKVFSIKPKWSRECSESTLAFR